MTMFKSMTRFQKLITISTLSIISISLLVLWIICSYRKTYQFQVVFSEEAYKEFGIPENYSEEVMMLEVTYQPVKAAIMRKSFLSFSCKNEKGIVFEGKGEKLSVHSAYENITPEINVLPINYKYSIEGRCLDLKTGKLSENKEDSVIFHINGKKDRVSLRYQDYHVESPE